MLGRVHNIGLRCLFIAAATAVAGATVFAAECVLTTAVGTCARRNAKAFTHGVQGKAIGTVISAIEHCLAIAVTCRKNLGRSKAQASESGDGGDGSEESHFESGVSGKGS